ncbi:MAG: hypothetical protein QOG10_2938 [Kribbellaceae bacterium]|nr:hypothetical protein [Kribbellaceae bacterium]
MRSVADLDRLIGHVLADVVMRLRVIDTGRGSEALYRNQLPALLTELASRARVQSITASSAIEGVFVADTRRAERIIDGSAGVLRNQPTPDVTPGVRGGAARLDTVSPRILSARLSPRATRH